MTEARPSPMTEARLSPMTGVQGQSPTMPVWPSRSNPNKEIAWKTSP